MTTGPTGTDSLQLARDCLEAGRLPDAERAALVALESAPKDNSVRLVLATVKMRAGDMEGAHRWAAKSLQSAPAGHEALGFLSEFAWRTGRPNEAIQFAERLVSIFPDDAFGWNNLGFMNSAFERHDRAAICYAAAATKRPDHAPFHRNLGTAFAMQNRTHEAISAYSEAVQLDPTSFDSLSSLATQHVIVGEMRQAADSCSRAYALEPESARGLIEGAKARIYANRELDEAELLLRQALQLEPDNSDLFAHLGFVLQKLGDAEQANQCLLKSIALNPKSVGAYGDYFGGKRVSSEDLPLIERLAAFRNDPRLTAHDRRLIGFTLGKAYNELGRYGEAIESCGEAHRIEREVFGKVFDRSAYRVITDLMLSLFDEDPARWPGVPSSTSERPIFIIGMMRSGTTLVEQILSCHSQVAAGGELGFWVLNAFKAIEQTPLGLSTDRCRELVSEYLAILDGISLEAPRVTDKLPENFRTLGLLRALFPNAKFIHCRRDPLDTCISIYMQPFTSPPAYVHDRADLVFAYREYERLTAHWRKIIPPDVLFEVNYHEMVAEPEQISRDLLRFCGLEWEEACLRPEENRRAVFTASHWQVRQPVYATSVGRWKRYEPWLGALGELQKSSQTSDFHANSAEN